MNCVLHFIGVTIFPGTRGGGGRRAGEHMPATSNKQRATNNEQQGGRGVGVGVGLLPGTERSSWLGRSH